MSKNKVIKINSIDEYKNKFNDYNTLQENFDVMICDKDLAEEIIEGKLEDKYKTNVRCTHCGSTEFDAVYDCFDNSDLTLGVGYFKECGDIIDFKEMEGRAGEDGKSYYWKYYICSKCSCAEIDDIWIDII